MGDTWVDSYRRYLELLLSGTTDGLKAVRREAILLFAHYFAAYQQCGEDAQSEINEIVDQLGDEEDGGEVAPEDRERMIDRLGELLFPMPLDELVLDEEEGEDEDTGVL